MAAPTDLGYMAETNSRQHADKMSTLYYLAYGSNLHPLRLQERVSSARLLGPVSLPGYRLVFHKVGADGSGKCNIRNTRHAHDTVHAALFSIHATHKPLLDSFEGRGYVDIEMQVEFDGATYSTFVYVAKAAFINEDLPPFDWYRDLVLHGAHHHGFPDHYIADIRQTMARADPDAERGRRHADLLDAMRNRR